MIAWTLPYPPVSVNHLWRQGRGGRVYLNPIATGWRDEAIITFRLGPSGAVLPSGDLSIEIVAWPPDRRRRDADNLVKLALDALASAFNTDDERFRFISVRLRRYDPAELARLRVGVRVLTEQEEKSA